ncbi:uncharacterized protein LOC127172604 isoform X2 [Labeo rohita]|uniref:uncharacterized protein LOC127172604 isoform X2 n=1 Tax=Labeo rohita TaxID=84645 RepID=UPI0021E2D6A4|nr:uncharacterized protein LOC127172604 isoform X2 [Labeo rohita]
MVKRCSYGTCNADSRYPDRLGNTQFHPFPKPARNLEKCIKWIRLCGRPHQQLSLDKLRNHSTAKHIYVCSKHFIDGRPTPAHPDPLPALTYDRSNVTPAKRPAELQTVSVPSRKRLRDDCHLDDAEDIRCDLQVVSVDIKEEMATEPIMEDTTTEESTTVPKIATGEDKEKDVQGAAAVLDGVPQLTPVIQSNIEQSDGVKTGLLFMVTNPAAVASNVQTCPSTSGTYIAFPIICSYRSDEPAQIQPKSEPAQIQPKSEEHEVDISMPSLHSPSDTKDTSSVPTNTTLTSTPTIKEETEDEMWKERNWIVNESNLMELFKRCQECGAVITEIQKITSGRFIHVQWECEKGHQGQWSS